MILLPFGICRSLAGYPATVRYFRLLVGYNKNIDTAGGASQLYLSLFLLRKFSSELCHAHFSISLFPRRSGGLGFNRRKMAYRKHRTASGVILAARCFDILRGLVRCNQTPEPQALLAMGTRLALWLILIIKRTKRTERTILLFYRIFFQISVSQYNPHIIRTPGMPGFISNFDPGQIFKISELKY